MKVADVLKTKGHALFTAAPDTRLSQCVITMATEDIGSIVIMAGGELKGIVTFREVIQILALRHMGNLASAAPPIAELRADQVMIRRPVVATPDMDVAHLREIMVEQRQRYLPVVDGKMLVGVVSFHDVVRTLNEQDKFENSMLKAYIRDWPLETA